jgi:hypothetical protein
VTPNPSKAAVTELTEAIASGSRAVERVSVIAKKLSLEGTGALFGTLGGFVGMAASYGLVIAFSAVSLPIALPLGLGIGVAGSLLAFRGTSSFRNDRAIEYQRRQAIHLLEQIKLLPRNAPSDVRSHLWLEYKKCSTHIPDASLPRLPAPQEPPLLNPPDYYKDKKGEND